MALTLLRGLPGSGKSSFAEYLSNAGRRNQSSSPGYRSIFGDTAPSLVAADDFRVDEEGNYCWLPGRKANEDAHGQCIARVRELVRMGREVVVHNTFVRLRELNPYRKIAREFGCKLQIITVHDPLVTDEELFQRCKHGVPLEQIADMRRRFQH